MVEGLYVAPISDFMSVPKTQVMRVIRDRRDECAIQLEGMKRR